MCPRSRNHRIAFFRATIGGILSLALLSACTANPPKYDLEYYQAMVEKNPHNQIYKLELQRVEFLKEQSINRQAQEFINLERYEAAKIVVETGLEELPDSLILEELYSKLQDLSASDRHYEKAIELAKDRKISAAIEQLELAVRLHPGNAAAFTMLKKIKKRQIATKSSSTIDLNFKKLDLRSAIDFIARSYGINVIFDEGVKDMPITLNIESLDFYQSLDIVLQMSRHYFKIIDSKTIVIYPDSKDKRAQYEELVLRAMQLEYIDVKDMTSIIKSVLDVSDVTVNEGSNLLMIRETPQVMGLIEQLVMINDVPQPQVLLDVEILEINKSNSKQLGTDFGSYQIDLTSDSIPVSESILDSINSNSELTIPTVTLRALKQDVGAKILANPKIRVVNRQEAKIHIGDRVPLRSSSILDATGQTRTTFEYQEIGIRLAVKPQIHPNNNTTLQVSLEVSALGENLGTTDEPAFRIGSRNAETVMVLDDGESVLLGGLIREEERRSFSSIPGIDQHSVLRDLFSFTDESAGRTDVLLTITPRVIRGNRLNEVLHDLQMKTGTLERSYSPTNNEIYRLKVGKPSFQSLADFQEQAEIKVMVDGEGNSPTREAADESAAPTPLTSAEPPENRPPTEDRATEGAPRPTEDAPVLEVVPKQQELAVGGEVTVKVQVSSLSDLESLSTGMLFNPNLLELKSVTAVEPYATDVAFTAKEGGNSLDIEASINEALEGVYDGEAIAEVTFSALRKGTSFIVLKAPVLKTKVGDRQGGIARNGRVTVN